MTRRTNARLAGSMFLLYIATAFPQMVLFGRASGGEGIASRLASIAQHADVMRCVALLSVLTFFEAVLLAIGLYGLTRDEDPELSLLALGCRVGEGVLNALPITTLGLLWLATASLPSGATDPGAVNLAGALLLKIGGWKTLAGATSFALASTIFAWLFLRARSIPIWLAWVGLIGSLLILIGLPLQIAGFIKSPVTDFMWIPVAVFEVVLGFWLLITGAPVPSRASSVTRQP
jgi:hypothetical protein